MKQCWQRLNVATAKWLSLQNWKKGLLFEIQRSETSLQNPQNPEWFPQQNWLPCGWWLTEGMGGPRHARSAMCRRRVGEEVGAVGGTGICSTWSAMVENPELAADEAYGQECGQEASGWMREVKDQRAEVGMSLGTCLMALLTDSI